MKQALPTAKKQAGNKMMQPRVVLPILIFTAVLMVGLRVSDVVHTVKEGKVFPAIERSVAAEKAQPKKAEEAKAPEVAVPPTATHEVEANSGALPKPSQIEADEEMDPSILKQLSERRMQLEQKAQELDTREAIVKVAEGRVEQKIKELEGLKAQLQTMVNTANGAQQAQLENLVKIYETMKAKEAAKIFETLEMPTLLGVVERMKPARLAVIMAEMAPEKAKELTVALTKKDQLPQVK